MGNGQAPFGIGRIGANLRTTLAKWLDVQGLPTQGALQVAEPQQWAAFSTPAAATLATVTRGSIVAAPDSVVIVTSIAATLIIPPAVNQPAITLNLSETLGGVVWSHRFGVGAAVANGLVQQISLSGLMIVPLNSSSAWTLAFSAAGAATTLQSVAMTGIELPINN